MTDTTIQALAEQNIFAPALLQCPYPFYQKLREHAPVLRNAATGIYQVSSYDLIVQVLRDHDSFSNRIGDELRRSTSPEIIAAAVEGYAPVDTMITADPPVHTRYRKMVNKAFSPARVNALEPEIGRIADELIDGFVAKGEVEFLAEFGQKLPLRLIAAQLGVPPADLDRLRTWSDAITILLGQAADPQTALACTHQVVAFQKYFAAVLAAKRLAPSDDIISDLATVTLTEDGDPRALTDGEALSVIQQILVAGNETTANTIVGSMKLLLEHPEQMAALLADATLMPNFVEEAMRLTTAVHNTWRVAAKDVELGGVQIPAGAKLLLRYGSANTDETQFGDAERFDITRPNARRHLALGMGIHVCLGASLARKELTVAFTKLLGRIAGWRLAPGKNDFSYQPSLNFRGLRALHLAFNPG